MANVDAATGLSPARYLNGAPYNGQANKYYMPATDGTAAYVGDLVKLAGSSDSRGIPSVTKASSTNAVVGVVVAVMPVTRDSTVYREASVERYVMVADDPNILFEVQEDSVGGAMAAADVGLNANWIDGGGSTTTGLSGIELDSSTKATTNTLDFQILRMADREDNEIGTNAKWLVRLNNHQFVDGVTGV